MFSLRLVQFWIFKNEIQLSVRIFRLYMLNQRHWLKRGGGCEMARAGCEEVRFQGERDERNKLCSD